MDIPYDVIKTVKVGKMPKTGDEDRYAVSATVDGVTRTKLFCISGALLAVHPSEALSEVFKNTHRKVCEIIKDLQPKT